MIKMDEIDVMKKALGEYEHARYLKRINQDLYNQLTGSIYWLLKYAEKNNIFLPKKEELFRLVENSHFYIDQFAKPQQPKSNTEKTTDNETEP